MDTFPNETIHIMLKCVVHLWPSEQSATRHEALYTYES
jgi:hypothetical protein